MKGLLLIILGLMVLCLLFGVVAIEARLGQGELVFVDGSRAFVYPDGDTTVLVLEEGEFSVEGSAVQGCYELIGAGLGEERGRAVWTANDCPMAKGGR